MMNKVLLETVNDEEINFITFSIKPSSAHGYDDMSGLFFQHY